MKKLLFFLMAMIFAMQGWSQTTLSEGFESTTFPPDDWMIVNTLGPSTPWTRSTSYSQSGSACAFTNYNSSGAINYMITPKLVINSLTDSISFWARMDYFDATYNQTFLKILVSTTDNNVISFDTTTLLHISPSFTSTPNNQITDVWKKWTISLSDYIGQDIYIAFRQTDNDGYGLCIDDVTGPNLFVPTCAKPKNITATNITTTTADIGWTPGNASDLAWRIYYRVAGAGPWDSISTSTNPTTISNLSPSGKYEVRIATDCGVEMSELSTAFNFKTSCGLISSIPWTDNFDSYGTGTTVFPDCWTRNTTYANRPYINSTSFSSPGSLYFYAGTTGTYNIAILPQFDVTVPLNTLRVKFKYRNTYTTDTLKIGVMTDTTAASWTQVGFVTAPTTSTWGDYEVSLASYQGTGQYIALRADYSTTYTYAYVDDLEVSYIPACAKPTNFIVSNTTTTSADIAWTPGNTTDFAWWIYYSVAGSGAWDSVYATMNPYNLNNLLPSTVYDVYFRTDCGIEVSEQSATFKLTTNCDALITFPWTENFDNYGTASGTRPICWAFPIIYSNYPSIVSGNAVSTPGSLRFQSETTNPTYAISPQLGIDINTLRVKFKLKREGTSSGNFEVGVMSSNTDTSTFESVQIINPTDNLYNDYEFSFAGTTLTGANNFIAFRHLSNASHWYYWLDDVIIDYIPACNKPQNITFSNLTTNSVDIAWTPGNTTDFAWWIYYRPVGTTAWDSTYATMNPHTLNLLNTSTSYEVEIRTDCGVELSEASSLAYFQTLCASIDGLTDLPWNEGFEGIAAVNDLPACWSATGLGTYTYTQIADYGSYNRNARTGTKSAYFRYGCNDKFTTPVFDLYAGQTYAFSFWYVTDGLAGWQNLQLRARSVADTSISIVLGSPVVNPKNTTYQVYVGDFSPTQNGLYEYIIECQSTTDPYYLTIDDIRLEVSNCGIPGNVAFANVTATNLDLTWDMGNNNQWVVSYKLSTDTIWTDALAVTNSYSFYNLTPHTNYDFKVTSICGIDTSMFITKSLTTPCLPISTLPWTEDFNSYADESFPQCWYRPITYIEWYTYQTFPAVDTYWGTQTSMMITSGSNPTYVITPQIDFDINALRVRFKLQAENPVYSGSITVGLVGDPNNYLSTFDSITTIVTTNTNWTQFEVSFANAQLQGHNKSIAFRHNPSPDYFFWIDDIIIDSIPSCPKPTSLSSSNITTNSADINWVAGSQTTNNWWLYWKESSAANYDSVYVSNVFSYSFPNLNTNTVYEYYMITDCSTELSEPTSVYNFRTTCAAISSVPWTDYFDSYGTGSTVFPPCWTRNTTYSDRPYISTTNFTAPGSMYFYSSSTTYNIAATPQFDITIPINTLQASFMLRKTSVADELIVGVMTDPAVESTFIPIDTVSPSATSTWEAFDVNFSSYTGTGTYIAFKSQLSSTNAMYLDNLEVYTIPTCTRPNAPTASNPTNTSIDVSWTDPNVNNTLYKVYYRMLGDTTWSVINNATSPTTLSGLNGSTTYQVAIATDCSVEESILTTPVLMQTACGPMNIPTYKEQFLTVLPNTCWSRFSGQLPATGDATLTSSTSGWIFNSNLTPNNARVNLYSSSQFYWLVTPSVDLAGGAASNRLEFDVFFTGYANANPPSGTNSSKKFVVLISTDDGLTWNSTNILKQWDNAGSLDTLNSLTNVVKNISIPIVDSNNTPYTGIVKFAFYGESTASSEGDNDLHIDNFQVVGQGCDAPTNIVTNNITSASADISWNPGSTETAWQVRQGTTGAPIDVTTTSYSATGLTPNTSYTYYIRSNCGISYSGWVPVTFTTDNMPLNPTVITSPITAFTHNTATFIGSFIEGTNTVTAIGFDYKLASASNWTNTPITPVTNPFNYSATGLIPNTAYKVRAYATTSAGTFYGDSVNFTTDPLLPPTVTTDTVIKNTTDFSAVFQGTTTQGTNAIIARGFEYKLLADDWSTAIDLTASGSANITATATGLAGVKYQVRAYAETLEGGKTYGDILDFNMGSSINSIDTDNLNVNLYPNPASNNTTLSIKGINGKVKISITDVQGRTISTIERESSNGEVNHSINLEAYAKGVYYIRIQSESSIKTQKLIVQ
ncbi:MAG: choice-of-anchor J domain-containing protein [Bacteroidales bacterium]